MSSPVARVGVPVEPDVRGFGAKLRNEIERDSTLGQIGQQHGRNYASEAVKSGSHALKTGMGAAWRAVAATGAAVGAGALSAGAFGLKVASQNEQAQISFETMLGSAQKAQSFLKDLQAFAAKTPFEFPELQTAASSLVSVGVDASKVIPIMTNLGNVTSGMGTGSEGVKRATVALQQMSAAGRITGEDLNQLRDAGVPVFDLLAAATGKSKKEVAGLAQAGKLGSKELGQLMSALESGKGLERFSGLMDKQSHSLLGMWSTLKDTFGQGMARAIEPALPTIKKFMDGASTEMSSFFDGISGKADKSRGTFNQVGLGVRAMFLAFKDGDVTSDGIVGRFEQIGAGARQVKLGVAAMVSAFKDGDVTSGGFVGQMERLGVQGRKVADALQHVDWATFRKGARDVWAQVSQIDFASIGQQLRGIDTAKIGTGFSVMGKGLGFVADHIDLVVKALPFLIAGFVAYKAAQAAGNVAALASIPIHVAQVGANIMLARAVKSLAKAQAEQTAAGVGSTAQALVSTAVTNGATASTVRGRAATIASAAAQKIAAGASIAFSVAQRAVGAAMTFALGPVGLIIIGVAAAAAGLIYAYKHSERFRSIVNATFSAVGKAAQFMWNNVFKPVFKFLVDAWFTVAGAIVDGGAKAFGWVPGIGGKLKTAAAEFNKFRDKVNTALDGTTKPRTVTVSAKLLASQAASVGIGTSGSGGRNLRLATGGPVWGAGTSTSDSIDARLSNDEHVVTAREVKGAGGHAAVEATRAMWARRGFAAGGRVGQGIQIDPSLVGFPAFQAKLDDFDRRIVLAAARLAAAGSVNAGLNGAQQYAKQIASKGAPYVWAASGPDGWDCSGWMSTLIHVARGDKNRYSRIGATGSMPWPMMASGPGAFSIGWTTDAGGGIGHTAGTINGYNTESRGGRGVVGGAAARGANDSLFTHRAHLVGFARGGRVRLPGDPPFDLLDPRGFYYRPDLAQQLRSVGRHRDGLSYVPHDDYPAMLHRGERVLTAQQNGSYADGRGQGGVSVDDLRRALLGLTLVVSGDHATFVARELANAGNRGAR